jgi:folate-binding protein YgfZ
MIFSSLTSAGRFISMSRRRARTVEIAKAAAPLSVYALLGPLAESRVGPFDGGVIYADPRLAALGTRAAMPRQSIARLHGAGFAQGERTEYERLRLQLGVPDDSRDLTPEKSLLMENGFDELHGIDFEKGCYVGQEITARMKHRALVKKRLLPVTIEGAPPPPGTSVHFGRVESGEMRSSHGTLGLAVLRLDHVELAIRDNAPFTAAGARLTPRLPDWLAS